MELNLAPIIDIMRQQYAMDVAPYDPSFLAKALEKRLAATACYNLQTYLRHLANDRAEAEILLRSLLVVYSEFFRNPLVFALLEQLVLPALVEAREKAGRSELRIWSAGCASGEEAYSVAILLEELARIRGVSFPYRIFATDLSEPDLERARAGVFSAASAGNIRLRYLEAYFSHRGEVYTLAGGLRERVDFSFYNILDTNTTCPPASIFGNFDLVLCCNVLLYYRPEAQRFIAHKLARSLATGGYLVTGETERQIVAGTGGLRAVAMPAPVFCV